MPVIAIDDWNDPRLAPYRALKDRELAREGGRFIAEGEHLVRRLLASDFSVESVLLSQRRAEEMSREISSTIPVYVASTELLNAVIGFKFHSGVIACGVRKPRLTIDDAVPKTGRVRLVVCPEIANAENLGSMIRLSAALGATAMLLGERSCDPFWRQCVRVSMGAVFRLPLIQSDDLLRDLRRLREELDVELFATVLEKDAEVLDNVRPSQRVGVLFGNEAQGLEPVHIQACQRKVTIPMHLGTDSLNVAVSAGIVLYHLMK
jgi:tRNA G18 (ribose-2'-O)-methylase SpoU